MGVQMFFLAFSLLNLGCYKSQDDTATVDSTEPDNSHDSDLDDEIDWSDDIDSEPCWVDPGDDFSSTEEHECGLGPNDTVSTCFWTLIFSEDTVTWNHSDVSEFIPYECEGYFMRVNYPSGDYEYIDMEYIDSSLVLTHQNVQYIEQE